MQVIDAKDDMSVIREHELENHIDESIWVEIYGKGTGILHNSTSTFLL